MGRESFERASVAASGNEERNNEEYNHSRINTKYPNPSLNKKINTLMKLKTFLGSTSQMSSQYLGNPFEVTRP